MKKATIELNGDTLVIDGIRVSFDVIPQFLYEIANPDPRKWYRFERVGDELAVSVMFLDPMDDRPDGKQALYANDCLEVKNGNYVRERGRSCEDAGGARQEAANPLDADRQN
jgi:hypothetical protein